MSARAAALVISDVRLHTHRPPSSCITLTVNAIRSAGPSTITDLEISQALEVSFRGNSLDCDLAEPSAVKFVSGSDNGQNGTRSKGARCHGFASALWMRLVQRFAEAKLRMLNQDDGAQSFEGLRAAPLGHYPSRLHGLLT